MHYYTNNTFFLYIKYISFFQRALIVNGGYEPTDDECQNPWRDDTEEEELARAVQSAAITEGDKKEEENKLVELVYIMILLIKYFFIF